MGEFQFTEIYVGIRLNLYGTESFPYVVVLNEKLHKNIILILSTLFLSWNVQFIN